jgi:hypothetical protein
MEKRAAEGEGGAQAELLGVDCFSFPLLLIGLPSATVFLTRVPSLPDIPSFEFHATHKFGTDGEGSEKGRAERRKEPHSSLVFLPHPLRSLNEGWSPTAALSSIGNSRQRCRDVSRLLRFSARFSLDSSLTASLR